MKSNKKITETAQMAKFTDFPLIFCGNGPKSTKTMQLKTHFSKIEEKKIRAIQGMSCESWRPELSKKVMVFYATIFKPQLWLESYGSWLSIDPIHSL